MTVLVNGFVMLYVLYSIKAPIWVFALVAAALLGDVVHIAYRVGSETNGKDGE